MVTGNDIQERLTDFAIRVIELSGGLPRTFTGRHIGTQLLRAGTAAAANYAEVRGAESRDDFIHKLGPVRKELNELCRIIASSRKPAEENSRLRNKP